MSVRSIAWSALLLLAVFPSVLAQQFGDPAAGRASSRRELRAVPWRRSCGACPRGDCRDARDDASLLERVLANATRLDAEPDLQRSGAERPDRLHSEFAPGGKAARGLELITQEPLPRALVVRVG